MHINALKTQLMHKNVQTNTEKSQKFTQHSCFSMFTREKILESNKRQWISFCPQRWHVPYRNHHACCEKLWFVRTYTQTCPKWEKKFTTTCRVPLHDSMPGFMNFRRDLDLLEFKNQVSQCLRPSDDGTVFDIDSYFLHRT